MKRNIKSLAVWLSLILTIPGKAPCAEPEVFPTIAGTHVGFETNKGTQDITYFGTNAAGTYSLKLTRAKDGQTSEIRGHYEVSGNDGWWTIKHELDESTFSLVFEIKQTFPDGGFNAKGNVLDGNGHPALNGMTPFDFYFEKAEQPESPPAAPSSPKQRSVEWH